MTYSGEELARLLPVIYRLRDEKSGGMLRGLLEVFGRQADVLDADIGRLYENWFIETCDEWVVPYIGDLLGVRGVHNISGEVFSQRARVANTLLYRQRKGTASMLEQLARDTTGWVARAVEFFERLDTTQYLNHLRPANLRTPSLRDVNRLELLGTAFDDIAHSADVRHIASNRGRHNIPNIGLFLWRLQAYFVPRGRPGQAAAVDDGRYLFSPLGLANPLFNRPRTETDAASLAAESNVPGMLRRRPLYEELEARRQALAGGGSPREEYFDETPVLQVWLDGVAVKPEEIAICNLGDPDPSIPEGWVRPPAAKTYLAAGGTLAVEQAILVGVDPALGRLALPEGQTGVVEVGYAYGFSGDVGAGPYNRQGLLFEWIEKSGRTVDWQIGVTRNQELIDAAPNPDQLKQTFGEAIDEWLAFSSANPGTFGLIVILDSDTYVEDLTGTRTIDVPAGSALAILAADWPVVIDPLAGVQRRNGTYVPTGLMPHLRGAVAVRGLEGASKGELILDGLLLEGNLTVLAGDLGRLRIAHSTLTPPIATAPERGRISVDAAANPGHQNRQLTIEIRRSITGPILLPDTVGELVVVDSVTASTADGDDAAAAIDADGAAVSLESVTVLGTAHARTLEASNSIFTGKVTAVRRQTGCLRFCHVPDGSETPRRYRCQPDLALTAQKNKAEHPTIRLRMAPSFTSRVFGNPGYAQLGAGCAPEIRTGAEDGSNMGAFSFLKQPQREINLRTSLDEYLRFGLEAGIFFVS